MRMKKISGKNFFIFEFYSESDFDNTIGRLTKLVDLTGPGSSEDSDTCKSIIEKLKSRTDDKYAKDDIKLTGLLFDTEVACLFEQLLFVQPERVEVKVKPEETVDPNLIRASIYQAAMQNIENKENKSKKSRRAMHKKVDANT